MDLAIGFYSAVSAECLQNVTRSHMAVLTHDTLTNFSSQWWNGQDVSPCDFHILSPMKMTLKGRRFHSDSEVMDNVRNWVQSQLKDFYKQDIHRTVEQWDKCLGRFGHFRLK